ncbi:hypothetical protein HNQ07_000719 [Deinococcus metalli]|uniref:Carboxypeptidase regulatory-like domain-containing protein n=1 Tax=Deinococcus metalli TaxID=1141878 RepID=A0A7W8NP16_9DEIO|nr:hypothetical protein [Deinococcus metalli]MBB5375275.1 hypothetical protein [Deinococcus metalli]GHF30459.1 hypothetical protein GCM10017781_03220 [Deinococcus metalli]
MKPASTAFLVLALAAGQGVALTVAGTAEGAGPDTRIAGFLVSPFGQPLQEIVSVPVENGRFRLEIPTTVPSARAQVSLTPQNVSWPGVIDPITVSSPVQAAELKFFAYRDQNSNGHRDDQEALREVPPMSSNATLFVTWVSGDVTVTASRGYQATLKRGWNAFLVEVGRAVAVQPFSDNEVVSVRLRR